MTQKVSIAEEARNIGRKAKWTVPIVGLIVLVEIMDVEIQFGRPTYIVRPVAGEGQAKIRENLEIINEQ